MEAAGPAARFIPPIGVMGADGRPCSIRVLPLARQDRDALGGEGAVMVTVSTPDTAPAVDAMAETYGFTPAETRILEQLCSGHAPPEIAAGLDVSLSTVKTHLLQMFRKTGLHRQADLVKLGYSLGLPLREL